MKILFLDIDGVLNSSGSIIYWLSKGCSKRKLIDKLCPLAVSNLNYLLKKCKSIKVIVHSSRRYSYSWDKLKKIFEREKLNTDQFLGTLNRYKISSEACHDIDFFMDEWNEEHPEDKIEIFAILDDCRRFRDEISKNVFYTDSRDGLTYSTVFKLARFFEYEVDIFSI